MNKKTLILNILDILRRYSDKDRPLSQKQIADILEKEYDMRVDRKSVKRNLDELKYLGYDIEYSEKIRKIPVTDRATGKTSYEENIVRSDYYLDRNISDPELRFLVDSILFSNHIPRLQCKALTDKLGMLAGESFRRNMVYIDTLPEKDNRNKQIFYTIEVLWEAIRKKKRVEFCYLEYQSDKKLHKKCDSDGNIRVYRVSPYQMASKEGKYYLICNYDKYNDISNYRIDRISDIVMTDIPCKSFDALEGADSDQLDIYKYMTEHVYMYSSKNIRATLRIPREMISDVIDMFGPEVSFYDEYDNRITVSAYTNESSVLRFAKSYSPDVVILSPEYLVKKMREDIEKTLRYYKS